MGQILNLNDSNLPTSIQITKFQDTDGLMFEKYDVRRVGPGSGGEYDVQTGFGWTNGVAISLLARYTC